MTFFDYGKRGVRDFLSPMKMKMGGSNIFPQSYFGGPILFTDNFEGTIKSLKQ